MAADSKSDSLDTHSCEQSATLCAACTDDAMRRYCAVVAKSTLALNIQMCRLQLKFLNFIPGDMFLPPQHMLAFMVVYGYGACTMRDALQRRMLVLNISERGTLSFTTKSYVRIICLCVVKETIVRWLPPIVYRRNTEFLLTERGFNTYEKLVPWPDVRAKLDQHNVIRDVRGIIKQYLLVTRQVYLPGVPKALCYKSHVIEKTFDPDITSCDVCLTLPDDCKTIRLVLLFMRCRGEKQMCKTTLIYTSWLGTRKVEEEMGFIRIRTWNALNYSPLPIDPRDEYYYQVCPISSNVYFDNSLVNSGVITASKNFKIRFSQPMPVKRMQVIVMYSV